MPSSVYTEEYFLSGACEGYDSYIEGGVSKLKARRLDLLDVRPGMVVLDVGCGRGEMAAELIRRDARVVAIDYSEAAVGLSARLLGSHAPVVRADATHLPFKDGAFDRLLLSDVIEHINRPLAVRALRESGRVLRRGGTLLVHTAPNVWFTRVVLPILRLALPRLGMSGALERVRLYDAQREVMHPNELSPLALHRLLRAAGLRGRIWIDREVLRGGTSEWTRETQGSRMWRWAAAVTGAWPLRLVFGNDIYARASRT